MHNTRNYFLHFFRKDVKKWKTCTVAQFKSISFVCNFFRYIWRCLVSMMFNTKVSSCVSRMNKILFKQIILNLFNIRQKSIYIAYMQVVGKLLKCIVNWCVCCFDWLYVYDLPIVNKKILNTQWSRREKKYLHEFASLMIKDHIK